MRYETIYGETFEVIKPKREVKEFFPTNWDYSDIYEAYERPSRYKVKIWEDWCRFGKADDERYFIGEPWITACNTFKFTVTMNVYDKKNDYAFVGVMVITRDHNRLYLA